MADSYFSMIYYNVEVYLCVQNSGSLCSFFKIVILYQLKKSFSIVQLRWRRNTSSNTFSSLRKNETCKDSQNEVPVWELSKSQQDVWVDRSF